MTRRDTTPAASRPRRRRAWLLSIPLVLGVPALYYIAGGTPEPAAPLPVRSEYAPPAEMAQTYVSTCSTAYGACPLPAPQPLGSPCYCGGTAGSAVAP